MIAEEAKDEGVEMEMEPPTILPQGGCGKTSRASQNTKRFGLTQHRQFMKGQGECKEVLLYLPEAEIREILLSLVGISVVILRIDWLVKKAQ